MVGLVHGQGVARWRGKGLASKGFTHLVDIGGLGFFRRLRPHMNAHVSGFHRIVGHGLVSARQVFSLGVGFPVGHKPLVDRVIHRLEVVPGGEVAHQRFGVDAAQFLFAHRERNHGYIGGFESLVGQLFIEGHVGVAIDRGDHGRLAARRELFDVGHDGLVIAVTKRGVNLFDVFVGYAFSVQEGAQDFIGGAWVHVIGAQQHETLGAAAVFAHQVFNSWDRLLVGRGPGVEHVRRHFFALVLHGVEQQAVEFFKHGQHGLARHRCPAAKDHGHLVLSQ